MDNLAGTAPAAYGPSSAPAIISPQARRADEDVSKISLTTFAETKIAAKCTFDVDLSDLSAA